MPRRPRNAVGGLIFHVLNRAVGRGRIFRGDADYAALLRVVEELHRRMPTRVLSYCLMPNHWHFVLWPREDGELSEFMRLLTVTHTQRWHAHRHSAGTGPLYQGRFKSFPVERDEHFLAVCRYVERNPLRAGLVERAESWPWSSLGARGNGAAAAVPWLSPLSQWPAVPPPGWVRYVNRPQTAAEEAAIAESIRRGRPYGDRDWQEAVAKELGLESSMRPRGRPRLTPATKDSRPL